MRALKSITPSLNQDFTHSNFYNLKRVDKNIYLLPKEKHNSTLIWLHGLGDNAENYLALFNNPDVTPLTAETKVIMLTAGEREYNGETQTSWYSTEDKQGSTELSRQYLADILNQEVKLLGSPQNVYIGGFSQGCMMALLTGLSMEYTLGGIMACSGLMFNWTKQNQYSTHTPIMIYHGAQDDRVSWQMADASYDEFRKSHEGPIIQEVVEGQLHALCFKAFQMMKQFFKVKSSEQSL